MESGLIERHNPVRLLVNRGQLFEEGLFFQGVDQFISGLAILIRRVSFCGEERPVIRDSRSGSLENQKLGLGDGLI